MANARKWNVMTLPVLAILYLSAIKYKNDPGSLAIKAFENSIKAIKGAIEPVGCRDFCTAIYCKMITSKKKKKSKEDWQMKGYDTSNGYMGYVEGKYILFASEREYFEFMED